MRKEARKTINPEIAHVQGYHGDRGQQRAFGLDYSVRGFRGNWYFNSDRKEKVHQEGHFMVRDNGQAMQGFGLEIETECRGVYNQAVLAEVLDKIVFPVFKFGADMFKMQNDISLGGDTNAEIITQVMTKQRIRNDYASYKAMFDKYFPAFGITADSYETTCGMHVNVSNAVFGKTEEQQIEAIRKLYHFINRNYELSLRLLYRDPSKRQWCGRMYDDARTLDLQNASGSHGNCLNLSHFPEGRIEIRLVGGQKNYYCFRNTMETIFFLCDRMRTIGWDEIDNLAKVFKGCNQYVYKRLFTECADYLSQGLIDEIYSNVKEEDLELHN